MCFTVLEYYSHKYISSDHIILRISENCNTHKKLYNHFGRSSSVCFVDLWSAILSASVCTCSGRGSARDAQSGQSSAGRHGAGPKIFLYKICLCWIAVRTAKFPNLIYYEFYVDSVCILFLISIELSMQWLGNLFFRNLIVPIRVVNANSMIIGISVWSPFIYYVFFFCKSFYV